MELSTKDLWHGRYRGVLGKRESGEGEQASSRGQGTHAGTNETSNGIPRSVMVPDKVHRYICTSPRRLQEVTLDNQPSKIARPKLDSGPQNRIHKEDLGRGYKVTYRHIHISCTYQCIT